MLLDRIRANPSVISLERVIDAIYTRACSYYKGKDFDLLRLSVPINLNRQVGHFMVGNAPLSTYIYHPLLFHAAVWKNFDLIKYLVGQGVNILQPDQTGLLLTDLLRQKIKYNPQVSDSDKEKLQEIYEYLMESLKASQVTSSVVQAKPQ
jgi:hypothetical protein